MPTETSRSQPEQNNPGQHEDEPIPSASEDKVLDDTARLAREGRKELESDPREPKSS